MVKLRREARAAQKTVTTLTKKVEGLKAENVALKKKVERLQESLDSALTLASKPILVRDEDAHQETTKKMFAEPKDEPKKKTTGLLRRVLGKR